MAAKKKKNQGTGFEFALEGDAAERSRVKAPVTEPAVTEQAPAGEPADRQSAVDTAEPTVKPRRKKRAPSEGTEASADTAQAPKPTVKKKTAATRKAVQSEDAPAQPASEPTATEPKPAPKKRKPKEAPATEPTAEAPTAEPAKKKPRKRPTSKPADAPSADGTAQTAEPTAELPPPILPVPTDDRAVSTETTVPVLMPEREKRAFWVRVLALLVLAAIIATSILIFRFRPASYSEKTHSIAFFYNAAQNHTVVVVNGTNRGEKQGAVSATSYNKNGEVAAALIGDKLIVVKGNDAKEIASGVSDFVLSTDGNAVAYRAGDTLYYATVGKDNTKEVSGAGQALAAYCLSPNGRDLFFSYDDSEAKNNPRVDFYSLSGKAPFLDETAGMMPLAIANDCAYIYFTDAAGRLFVLNGKSGERKLCTDTPDMSSLVFNRDNTELLLESKGTSLLFADGESRVLPDVAEGERISLLANRRVTVRELPQGRQYMLDTLLRNYYLQNRGSGTMLVYLGGDARLKDVSFVSKAESVTVTDKGVFFLQDNEEVSTLYRCKIGATEKERLEWNVSSFCTNVDGGRLLYTNVHGKLYFRRTEGGVAEQIHDNAVPGSIRVSLDDTFYFYAADGELWSSDNGGAPRHIHSGVSSFTVDAHTLYFLVGQGADAVLYSNHRDQRRSRELQAGISALQ